MAAWKGILCNLDTHRANGALFCFLSCLMCSLWSEYSHAEGGESKIADLLVIEPQIVDFGRVTDSCRPLELSFTITNRGDQPIEITRARSGCGCTVAKLSKSVVPPHGHILVSVKVNILGRRGKFKKRVLLDVSGQAEPIAVPIQGTIIQDLWINVPMVQCFATDSEPVVEKTFEVYTVNWPSVKFDWNGLDKAISIQELSRSTKADETVIKFRLRVDAGAAQNTTTWHVILTPLNKQIKPLTIPVVYYRPSLRKNDVAYGVRSDLDFEENPIEAVPVLQPDRISLGVVPRGEERQFQVSGPSKLVNSLKVAGIDNLPEGTKVELHPMIGSEKDSIGFSVHIAKSANWGMFDGRIRLKAPDGHEYSIAVLGIMGPEDPGKKSCEAKDGAKSVRDAEGKLSSRNIPHSAKK